MNILSYLQYEFCTREQSKPFDRIDLAEALSKYDAGTFPMEQKDLFDSCVQQIVQGKLNRYNFGEEVVKKRFGFTSYEKSRLYQNLMFFEVGRVLTKGTDKHTLRTLDNYGDKMDYGFYLSYSMQEAKTKRLVERLSFADILKESRSFELQRDVLYRLCKEDIKSGMSDDDIISLITLYNDGSYVELPEYVDLLSHLLLRDGRYDQWAKMLIRLKYFPLQGALIYRITTIDEFMEVFQYFKQPNIAHRKVILYLLRKRFFQIICQQPKTLQQNIEEFQSDRTKDKYTNICKELQANWNKEIGTKTKEVITYLIEHLKQSECSEWYSTIRRQYADRDSKFIEFELKAIDIIGSVLTELSNPIKWNIKTAGINTLLYYIEQTETKQITKYRCTLLIQTLIEKLYDSSSSLTKYNEERLKHLRATYHCLEMSGLDALQLLQSVSFFAEGYKVDYSKAYKTKTADSFWFSMLLLGTGEKEDELLFDKYLKAMLNRVVCQNSDAIEYTYPLYTAELVLSQVLKNGKDRFESYVINNVSSLRLVLTTLLANQGQMTPSIKSELLERINNEWCFEEKLLQRRKDSNLKVLKEYIQQLGC